MKVWMVSWSWFGARSTGYCLYHTYEEALKDAVWHALTFADWDKFPDPARGKYPYDDRDGLRPVKLTPVFHISWDTQGGGFSQVEELGITDKFICGQQSQVELRVHKILKRELTTI